MEMAVRSRKNLKYYYDRLREEHKKRGSGGLSMLILSNLARKILRTNSATWYRMDLNGFVPTSPKPGSPSFGFMSLDEAQDFFINHQGSFPWMFVKEEMEVAEAGRHVFPCLRDDDAVIGYIKLGIEKAFVLDFERILYISPGAAFIYDTFISPSHRGMNLGSQLVGQTVKFAREQGFRTIWCHIPDWNDPSKKAFRRVGFEAVGEIRFVKLFGKDYFRKHPKTFPLSIGKAGEKSNELMLSEAMIQ